ncbi:MAG: hypothetical protein IPH26_06000 [Sterolibacteriaceae bacterium]|uniref:Uncharacterized protein n=1 Tax=Candidatus Methylophosphatis roskildensis TaxID=2899263 RepID=A0A9D7HLA9_9PROT|nr:hypothetical protein [Candidatus Methylophosphatis roskildensis]MBK7235978.1 hypothetical protein [Sterolibacteriaceae bacterium]
MTEETELGADLANVSEGVLGELTKRVQDIDNNYRAVAEKMGQLYMCADENKVASLTRRLDKPMRNASDNEQTFSAILEELRMQANRSP